MLVRILATQFRDAAGMVWVKVELEPLVAEAIVVDLKTPFGLTFFIAKLTALKFSTSTIGGKTAVIFFELQS